jgi:hypothetical protein
MAISQPRVNDRIPFRREAAVRQHQFDTVGAKFFEPFLDCIMSRADVGIRDVNRVRSDRLRHIGVSLERFLAPPAWVPPEER